MDVTSMYLETMWCRLELVADKQLGLDDIVILGVTIDDFIAEDIILGVGSE
jgi:hypothetical protein